MKTVFPVEQAWPQWCQDYSAAITIDLSKALDSINHNLLLAKLSAYGVTEDALQLLRSYLTDRKQHVKIDGNLSDWQIMKCGVPQGSILGPPSLQYIYE